jgi:hypothetical protein
VEEDRNLDKLNDGSGQLAKPVSGKANQETALGLIVDGVLLRGRWFIV